jgi:hypothetical protein
VPAALPAAQAGISAGTAQAGYTAQLAAIEAGYLVERSAHGLSAAQLENGSSEPDDRQFLLGLRSEAPKACSC